MRLSLLLSSVFIIFLGSFTVLNRKLPEWKTEVSGIVKEVKDENINSEKWGIAFERSKKLPPVFPFTSIRNIFEAVNKISVKIKDINQKIHETDGQSMDVKTILQVFSDIASIDHSLLKIEKNLIGLPDLLLSEDQKLQRIKLVQKIKSVRGKLEDHKKLDKIFLNFVAKESRILFLLQNQNEPRSTGGFVGNVAVIDFSHEKITWFLKDIYAFDRLVPPEAELPAPDFFHDLSNIISLRDANLWPDFPISAQKYRSFFSAIEEKAPDTVIAINLNLIGEILKLTGPIKFEEWGIELDEYNFDVGLSFLVESKISGRFSVKKPVMDFAQKLFSFDNLQKLSFERLAGFNFSRFFSKKNILAYSEDRALQDLFDKWQISGRLQQKSKADNFLNFDFVSIGANKSEKFMWTRIWHDSEIYKDGLVKNSLEIVRTHALREAELFDLLNEQELPQNIKSLLSENLLWVLGEGQNRTILRVYVPKDAKLISQKNISGRINETMSDNLKFKVFEIPMYAVPGDRLKIHLEYETKVNRGSHEWRPYFLQLVGTPGRSRTSFMETISTEEGGRFSAETYTIGRPQDLIDSDFRAVVEF